MTLDKLYPIVIYTLHNTLNIESMVSVNSSWKNVVANIENTLSDCLLNIGDPNVDVEYLVNEEGSVTKNILSREMETAAEALRDWIGKAKQCQDKVKSMHCLGQ